MRHPSASITAVMAGLLLVAAPAVAQEEVAASGTISIEGQPLTAPEEASEVKVGCAFRLDFFGFEEQTVPVELSLQPPSGEEQLESRQVQLEAATGSELSGSLTVDLTEELRAVPVADAEDFDYKVRVDVIVDEPGEGGEVTKSSILFIECAEAAAPADGDTDGGGEGEAGGEGDAGAGGEGGAEAGGDAEGDTEAGGDVGAGEEEADQQGVTPVGGIDAGAGTTTGAALPIHPAAILALAVLAVVRTVQRSRRTTA